MLLIHYVSVMMWIFCMDWQQYWKYGWILNIGANAHGKRTVSTKQPQRKWQTWQSSFQWHRETCIELVFKSLNSFTLRLFNSATIFLCYMYLCLKLNSNVFTVWWRILIRRGYFGVSNVALVCYTPHFNEVERGVYWYHLVRLSVCPSVDRIVSALYLQQYSSDPFHICTSYQATSEGVSRVMPVSKFKNLKF